MNGAVLHRASRLAGMEVSDILVRAAHAAALKKSGMPVIILAAGEPDFDTPDHIKQAANRAIAEGRTKYTAVDGSPELKAAVQHKLLLENNLHYDLNEITCGAGAKQVLFNALMATVDPGDEVITPAPYWTSYVDMVRIAGGLPVEIACPEEVGFLLGPEELEAAITPRTRWLLLNSPSNPSGAVYDASKLRQLADVLRRHPQVWALCDDMYEHILYDERRFTTLVEVAPDLRDRTLVVNGVSKAYAMTGWRVGYGAGPASLVAAMAVVQSQATSCPSSISQAAAIAALTGPQEEVRARRLDFQKRRDVVVAGLNAIPGLSCATPAGAFYAYPGCKGLIGARTRTGQVLNSDRDIADYLLEWDVAVIPGSIFGVGPHFRISYATSLLELRTAMERMTAACEALDLSARGGRLPSTVERIPA